MLSGAKFWNSLVQDKIKFPDNLIFKTREGISEMTKIKDVVTKKNSLI